MEIVYLNRETNCKIVYLGNGRFNEYDATTGEPIATDCDLDGMEGQEWEDDLMAQGYEILA